MPEKEYQIWFTDEQLVAIAERIRDGIDGELREENADEMVEAIGRLIADTIKEEGDADVVIQGVGDRIVEKLEGETADELIRDVADIVLDNLPGFGRSHLVKKAVNRIVRGLIGERSDRVVQGVGNRIVENRPNGDDKFECRNCGYELHADYNAAKNIAWKHVLAGQKSPRGRANRQLALKSGTVNANGDFTPAENIGQSGSSPTSPAP